MPIAVPTTGDRYEGQLVEDDFGMLRLITSKPARIDFVLSAVLALGWRIVATTPAERAARRAWLASGRVQ